MAPSCVCPKRTCFGFIEKHGSILCLSQNILLWVHWKAWLHLVFVPEHLVLGSLESMAPSCVCPRTSCFGFIEKHGSILCLSLNILFWVHGKAWLHLVFVTEHLVLGSMESMIFFFLVPAAAGNRGFLRPPQTTQCVSCCLLPVFCRCLPIFS
jgi:hypothetical protein